MTSAVTSSCHRLGWASYTRTAAGGSILTGKGGSFLGSAEDDAVLRPSMIRAYPGTKLGAGIDEHGVRLGDGEWARVAVVACNPVVSIPEFVRWIRSRAVRGHSKSILWTSVTKESWNHPVELAATNQKLREEGKEPYTPRWIEMIQNADIDVAPSLRNSTSYESMP